MPGPTSLVDVLEARRGIVCVVGAGGKKTLLASLAAAHDGRVAVTCTAKMLPFPVADADDWILCDDAGLPAAVLAAAGHRRIVTYAGPPAESRRCAGVAPQLVAALHAEGGFDATYVKADGARMRLVKAHKPGEPPLVASASTILSLASVRAVGRPLDERTAHRPELVAELSGAAPGEAITARHLGRLIARQVRALSSHGRVVPVLNMADDEALAATAREVAAFAFAEDPGLARIVVTSLTAAEPLVEVLNR